MPSEEHPSRNGDNVLAIAALTAAVLVSGSALAWRANWQNASRPSETVEKAGGVDASQPLLQSALSTVSAPPSENAAKQEEDASTEDSLESKRSKDRRRRGKDPLKDLMKSGKKGKALLKQMDLASLRSTSERVDSTAGTSSRPSSAATSQSMSSRDSSVVNEPLLAMSRANAGRNASAISSRSSSVSAARTSVDREPRHQDGAITHIFSAEAEEEPTLLPPESTLLPVTSSETIRPVTPPASDSTSLSNSLSSLSSTPTGITSPVVSTAASPPSTASTSASYVPETDSSPSTPLPPRLTTEDEHNGQDGRPEAWEWSLHQPTASTSTSATSDSRVSSRSHGHSSRKPPRFRSSSRQGSPNNTFVYPTFDTAKTSSPNALLSPPTSNSLLSPGSSRSSSPMPSGSHNADAAALPVSTQTQLASLRGALEATRIREEKNRVELEKTKEEADKTKKELESLRWSWGEAAGGWARREAEYQSQIQYFAHALQSYAFAAQQTQLRQHHQQHPNSHPGSPPPLSPTVPPYVAGAGSPVSPGYIPAQTQQQLHSANLLSLLFPGGGGPAEVSPHDMANGGGGDGLSGGVGLSLPTLPGGSGITGTERTRRGRRRTRDADFAGINTNSPGAAFTPVSAPRSPQEENVSSPVMLEDAILKRPPSMPKGEDRLNGQVQGIQRREHVLVASEQKFAVGNGVEVEAHHPQPQEPIVFTWPSLSNIGNVQGGWPAPSPLLPSSVSAPAVVGSVSDLVSGVPAEDEQPSPPSPVGEGEG